MVAGEGSRDQHATRELAYTDPARFQRIIDAIVKNSIIYLRGQIDAGAEAVQLFDSWAGSLAPDQFERWVIEPNAAITAAIKQSHPDTPVIGFPKGAGAKLVDYAERTGVDALGLDETIDPVWANRVLPQGMPVQGNLDPLMLMAGGEPLTDRVAFILAAFADRPHVFNLGHGIGQFTPIEHVEQLVAAVRGK
jgi:uroporphyrinogen decarboxylase